MLQPAIDCMQRLPVRCHNVLCTCARAWQRTCNHWGSLHPVSVTSQAVIVQARFETATIILVFFMLAALTQRWTAPVR